MILSSISPQFHHHHHHDLRRHVVYRTAATTTTTVHCSNPNNGATLRQVSSSGNNGNSNTREDDVVMLSSAAAVAAAIRKASTSPVEFVQRIEQDGKNKGLVLPSSDFQTLCIEQLDLFRRIVDPDALLSVYVRPAGSYVMDQLELRRVTVYPGRNVADIVIIISNFSIPAGLRAAEASLLKQQAEFIPESRALVFPMVKHPFVVGFLVAELPKRETGMEEDDVKQVPSPEESGAVYPYTITKSWEIQTFVDKPLEMHKFSGEQRLNAINISRSVAMAYVMDQKAMLLQQSSWQNNIRMSNLVEQIRGPLSSIRTLSKMLSVTTKKNEISYDVVEDILVQGDRMRETLQQLQDAVHMTKVMARLSLTTSRRRQRRNQIIVTFWNQAMTIVVWFFITICMLLVKYKRDKPRIQSSLSYLDRYNILHRYAYESDTMCLSQLRMTRMCFTKLCDMLETLGGLRRNRHMNIDEQVAIFLHIISHNVKNRVIICRFHRSGETISRLFTRVCNAVIRLHPHLLKKPEPVPENSTDQRWKWFKNCLGALDGTHIKCLVPLKDKPRYRTRKNDIATNVLGVCSQDMQFIYVLPGWEGSAADGRVLRDALLRPHGLKVPRPGYYLVDAGYTNGEGFLSPYRGQRYHLNDWRAGHQPTTPKEIFNMRHSSARNVIERCFGILKARWGILKDNSYYPIEIKNRIIMACCLLHNYIRQEMTIDPFENDYEVDEGTGDDGGGGGEGDDDNITSVGTSTEWTTFRNNLAQTMFDSRSVTS